MVVRHGPGMQRICEDWRGNELMYSAGCAIQCACMKRCKCVEASGVVCNKEDCTGVAM